jgi:hypothetical protein
VAPTWQFSDWFLEDIHAGRYGGPDSLAVSWMKPGYVFDPAQRYFSQNDVPASNGSAWDTDPQPLFGDSLEPIFGVAEFLYDTTNDRIIVRSSHRFIRPTEAVQTMVLHWSDDEVSSYSWPQAAALKLDSPLVAGQLYELDWEGTDERQGFLFEIVSL